MQNSQLAVVASNKQEVVDVQMPQRNEGSEQERSEGLRDLREKTCMLCEWFLYSAP